MAGNKEEFIRLEDIGFCGIPLFGPRQKAPDVDFQELEARILAHHQNGGNIPVVTGRSNDWEPVQWELQPDGTVKRTHHGREIDKNCQPPPPSPPWATKTSKPPEDSDTSANT